MFDKLGSLNLSLVLISKWTSFEFFSALKKGFFPGKLKLSSSTDPCFLIFPRSSGVNFIKLLRSYLHVNVIRWVPRISHQYWSPNGLALNSCRHFRKGFSGKSKLSSFNSFMIFDIYKIILGQSYHITLLKSIFLLYVISWRSQNISPVLISKWTSLEFLSAFRKRIFWQIEA